jgi:hypothetical protein
MANLPNNSNRETLRDLKLRELRMLEGRGRGNGILATQLRHELWPDPANRPAVPDPKLIVVPGSNRPM